MNTTNIVSTFFRTRRSHLLMVGALLLTGVLTFAAVTGSSSDAGKAKKNVATSPADVKVDVKVDSKEISRGMIEPGSFSSVAKRVAPSVVKITTETRGKTVAMENVDPMLRQFFGGRMPQMREQPHAGLGSGVIVSSDGTIVTNHHVVDGADRVTVTLDDGRELKAKVLGRDPHTDLAVVKVDAKELPSITFAESSKVEVGDRVLAVGNPFGLGETVTSGIVSAKSRRAGLGLKYEDFIQTDAAINPGNSGGALVDIEGRLIGINTAILSRSGGFQGVGLAVPSDLVRSVVDSLVRHGKVERGYLGVSVQDITPALAESLGLKSRVGALVADVQADSPASKAGLRSGDVITSISGKPVNDSAQLSLAVSQTRPDTEVQIEALRDGKAKKFEATTAQQPGSRSRRGLNIDDDELASNSGDDEGVLNGVAVTDIDPQTRRQLSLPPRVKGALVTNVSPESASAKAGLQPGDVILEINRKPVNNANDAVKLTEESETKRTLIKLWSRGSTVFTVVDESKEAQG